MILKTIQFLIIYLIYDDYKTNMMKKDLHQTTHTKHKLVIKTKLKTVRVPTSKKLVFQKVFLTHIYILFIYPFSKGFFNYLVSGYYIDDLSYPIGTLCIIFCWNSKDASLCFPLELLKFRIARLAPRFVSKMNSSRWKG